MSHENLVQLQNVTIDYQMKKFDIRAVTDCSLNIKRGKITALIGESGSGKTTLASSINDCISSPGKMVSGSVMLYDGENPIRIEKLSEKEKETIRWSKISMVFQAAQSALNPTMTVWEHFYETYHVHAKEATKEEILMRSKELLEYVKLDPERVLTSYAHELSGGMKQRVMIAFALLLNPVMMILDEPTTALDVITQDYIFNILRDINQNRDVTMLLMTHDVNVVAKFSDYVAVMYAGRIMEYGPTREVFSAPRHPYTQGLLAATPSLTCDLSKLKAIPGNPPDLRNLPTGCVFHDRCPYAHETCRLQEPEYTVVEDRATRCFGAKE